MTRKPAIPTDAYVARIAETLSEAAHEHIAQGRAWYDGAHALARQIDPHDTLRGSAVLSLLSPRRSWPQNVSLARKAYETAAALQGVSDEGRQATWNAFPTMGDQRRKLHRLFEGESPLTVVTALKTGAFMRTIADPSDPYAVVIDRHAMAVAQGRTMGADELSLTPRQYEAYADAYREVAGTHGMPPSTVQAITWCSWRRTRAVAFHGDVA